MHTNTKKDRIKRDLQGDLMDSNHVTRRFFRLWLDGSYMGADHYKSNVSYLRDALKANGLGIKLERAITPFVISQFVRFTAQDYDCSYGYAQKVIVDHMRSLPNPMEADMLASLTNELIGDALDLIADDIGVYVERAA